ncbi:NAD(P)-dependent oxidoreductase [Umezawaea sp. Da 62-37]|uniref:NAD(P)-dependent oxidoreductase n=1 Tax=Umezawaea sp. Da 62-37 TaxID=3075927 RepID=UPI0028F718EF|nr:NAD(P)-dependent oxidoreductase [Umezawaea sp. Da 62-37]WNV82649.1 NAD(P)-dependent oxidoreductase [Umezawaea sp. Da 62-37]
MTRIGFLGTGIMGLPMAANIAAAGFDVRAWNRTRARAEPLTGRGVEVVDTAREAVNGADVVVTMLADGPAVDEAVAGAGLANGRLWLQMSTVGVEWAAALARVADKAGAVYVDAPVLGTREPAEAGALVVLASGPDDVRERAAPVFDAVGSRTVWVGEAGAGSRLKLTANAWVLSLTNALAESLALAGSLGLDPALFLEAIKGGAMDAPYARTKGTAMIEDRFPPSFPARLAAKDARLVLDAGGDDVDLAGVRATLAHLDAAVGAGFGDEDLGVLHRAVRRNHAT